jgi:ABC-type sugar transport system ATPase subunit
VLLVSQDLNELREVADRILVMRGGRVACEFGAKEATQEKILECALGE